MTRVTTYHTTITRSSGKVFLALALTRVHVTRVGNNGSDSITIARYDGKKKKKQTHVTHFPRNLRATEGHLNYNIIMNLG